MKYFLITISLLLIFKSLFSQTNSQDSLSQSNAEKQALAMTIHFLKKDFKNYIACIYAPFIEKEGGSELMATDIAENIKEFEREGFALSNIKLENCSKIIHSEKQLQCTLTEVMEIKVGDMKIMKKSTLIGISDNKGITWKFIESHNTPMYKLKETTKELSDELLIPIDQVAEIISN